MKGIDMPRSKMKDKFNSTINHIKTHPAIYGYIAGAAVGAIGTGVAISLLEKNMKLVSLTDALKHIKDQGLIGLKYNMGDETMILIPTSNIDFDLG